LRLSTTGNGLGVIDSVGEGVKVNVVVEDAVWIAVGGCGVKVSVNATIVDVLLAAPVSAADVGASCPLPESVQESIVNIHRMRRYPFFICSLY